MYYNGTKLLSMRDIDGLEPELYMCTTNRTGGKTTYFSRYLVNRYLNYSDKFALLYRYNYELDDIGDKFFKDIKGLFFPKYTMFSKPRAKGIFHELFLAEESEKSEPYPCGYAISMNSSDQLKKYSHLFSDTARIFFDEFQSESEHYCTNEIQKFLSVHKTIARGQGKQVRHVPVIMCGNAISIINPYYVELGISDRLREDTNFLRGKGFVLENGFVESASEAQKESGISRAFANNNYIAYASQNVYLNDSRSFIENIKGRCKYLATLRYKGADYGVRYFPDQGVIYVNNHADGSWEHRISVTLEDHTINYLMLDRNSSFLWQLRRYFNLGSVRFKNQQCKECLIKSISYI